MEQSKEVKPPYNRIYIVVDNKGKVICQHKTRIYTSYGATAARRLRDKVKGRTLLSFELVNGREMK